MFHLQLLVKDFDKYSRHRVVGQVLLPCADVNVVKGVHLWKPLQPVHSVSDTCALCAPTLSVFWLYALPSLFMYMYMYNVM